MIFVDGMHGLGDNIFQRAFVRELKDDVYIRTSWPQLYADLDVKFVRPETKLRTQAKNVRLWRDWCDLPRVHKVIKPSYAGRQLKNGSIIDAMAGQFGFRPKTWDLPFSGIPRHKVAVIRPVTARKEWLNVARNPEPEYLAYIADDLRRRGYTVISVADFEDGKEWPVGCLPRADKVYHRGELSLEKLLTLIATASVVVGGVGWIVPAAICTGTPLFCVLGGQGGHNAPEKITDKSMDLSKVGFAYPDDYCMCENMKHACKKTISDLPDQWGAWADEYL